MRNLERYYRRRQKSTPKWTIVNADARQYRVPDDATVFYMATSVDSIVVGNVLDNILSSIQAAPRRIYLIYANPIHEHLAGRRGFEKIAQPTTDYVIYAYQ